MTRYFPWLSSRTRLLEADQADVRRIGLSGQISLGKYYAGQQVLVYQPQDGLWVIHIADEQPQRAVRLQVLPLDPDTPRDEWPEPEPPEPRHWKHPRYRRWDDD